MALSKLYPIESYRSLSERSLFGVTWHDFIQKNNESLSIRHSEDYTLNLSDKGHSFSINHSWDLMLALPHLIDRAVQIMKFDSSGFKEGIVCRSGEEKCFIHDSCSVNGQTFINAEKGPVIIDEGVRLNNFNSIEGPAYIGKDTILDNAQIRGPVITGRVCRLSGEIEESFIFDYVNKHHFGFIGHSILQDWVNLGAGTTNSDLKNNYGSIRMFDGDDFKDTGLIKLGCIIADHTKTAIGTLINTGTVIGPFCNIFSDIRRQKHIPAFSWGETGKYEIEKLCDSVKRVMARRGQTLSHEDEKRILHLYRETVE